MNTHKREIEQLPALQTRVEALAKECKLPASFRSLQQARILCGIARALLEAANRWNASSQAIEFSCETAAAVKGRIAVVEAIAVVSLTYMSSRASADALAAFWQRLGNVLQQHKRMTFLRNKKIGLRLHLPISSLEDQLFELADRAYLEAIAVTSRLPARELYAAEKALPASNSVDRRDSLELRPA